MDWSRRVSRNRTSLVDALFCLEPDSNTMPSTIFSRSHEHLLTKKACFVYFQCFSFFLPKPFLASPFFCFCFSVSFLLLSFFIPSCLYFLFFLCLLFLFFFIVLSSLLLFHEKNKMKVLNCNFCSSIFSLFCGFLSSFPFRSLFLIFVFPHFKLCFFVKHECFWFQTNNLKTQIFGKKGGCNKTFFFFYQPVFCKMSKVIVFFVVFLGNFWAIFKNTIKYVFQHLFKSQKLQKMAVFNGY